MPRISVPVGQSYQVPIGVHREYNGKWGRFGRWLLRKLSRPKPLTKTRWRFVTIDLDSLAEAILRQCETCQMIWNREVEMIVIGPDLMPELMDLRQTFQCFPEFCRSNGGRDIKIFGIPVRFVPYAKGVLCIPKGLRHDLEECRKKVETLLAVCEDLVTTSSLYPVVRRGATIWRCPYCEVSAHHTPDFAWTDFQHDEDCPLVEARAAIAKARGENRA